MSVRGIDFASVSKIFLLNFRSFFYFITGLLHVPVDVEWFG
jgi:hypothetical protein